MKGTGLMANTSFDKYNEALFKSSPEVTPYFILEDEEEKIYLPGGKFVYISYAPNLLYYCPYEVGFKIKNKINLNKIILDDKELDELFGPGGRDRGDLIKAGIKGHEPLFGLGKSPGGVPDSSIPRQSNVMWGKDRIGDCIDFSIRGIYNGLGFSGQSDYCEFKIKDSKSFEFIKVCEREYTGKTRGSEVKFSQSLLYSYFMSLVFSCDTLYSFFESYDSSNNNAHKFTVGGDFRRYYPDVIGYLDRLEGFFTGKEKWLKKGLKEHELGWCSGCVAKRHCWGEWVGRLDRLNPRSKKAYW